MGALCSVRATQKRTELSRSTPRDLLDAVAHGQGFRDHSVWVELSIRCKNLANRDTFSYSDPFVVLYQYEDNNFQEVGRTEVIANNLNPQFVHSFHVLYEFQNVQRFKLEVYDADEGKDSSELDLSKQDFLGEVEFSLSDLVTSSDDSVELNLLKKDKTPFGNSKIVLYYEEQTNQSDVIELSLSSTLTWNASQVFFRLSKQRGENTWIPTYCSEVVNSHAEKEYEWKKINMTLRQICNARIDRPLLFEVLCYRSNGKHVQLGEVVMTLKEVQERVDGSIPLVSKIKNKEIGRLEVNSFVRSQSPSFLEYIASGYEICFLVAIDFTKSNGMPDFPSSLHHIDSNPAQPAPVLNVYEEAILGLGRVLEAYDSDKQFQTWGFGAKIKCESNVVSHCFAVNGNDEAPQCYGVDGILDAYRESLQRVQFAGPTFFTPVIRQAANLATKAYERKYYCLLIITDGTLMDMTSAKREIIDASSLPLSIMIVGVGGEDFTKMEVLDSDNELLSEDGRQAERDIVQFVQFDKHKHNGNELARELLAEFPGQFLSYMRNNSILPRVPSVEASKIE